MNLKIISSKECLQIERLFSRKHPNNGFLGNEIIRGLISETYFNYIIQLVNMLYIRSIVYNKLIYRYYHKNCLYFCQ